MLEGDSNINFFHLSANGRRRKKSILSLEDTGGLTTDPEKIQELIYSYYKQLFGKQPHRTVSLSELAWGEHGMLTAGEIASLTLPFSEEEVKHAVFDMKIDSAPDPDGFSISFYRGCWDTIKGDLMDLINDFYRGNLDIKRLNYSVITLVPKIKEANNVKQFCPICLLNVSFRIFTKLLMDKLAVLMDKLVSNNQTAFIKGRYVLDGAVILHETMHELSSKKMRG